MEGLQELAQGLEAEVFVHAFRHATVLPCRFGGMGAGLDCARRLARPLAWLFAFWFERLGWVLNHPGWGVGK